MRREERAEMPDAEKEQADRFLPHSLRAVLLFATASVIAALAASAAQMSVQTIGPGQLVSIVGQHLPGPDGSDAGRVWDVLVDRAGQPRVAVIQYGGFAGMGRRKVAVAWPALHFQPDDHDHPITLLLNKAEMGRIPDFKDASGPIVFGEPSAGGGH